MRRPARIDSLIPETTTHHVRLKSLDPTKPIITVPQFFQFTSDSRLPTYAEERRHAIMSIVEGAKGPMWWLPRRAVPWRDAR